MAALLEVKKAVQVWHYGQNISGENTYLVRPESYNDLLQEPEENPGLRAPLRLKWQDIDSMEAEIYSHDQFTHIYYYLDHAVIFGRHFGETTLPIEASRNGFKMPLKGRRFNIRRQNGILVARITHITD